MQNMKKELKETLNWTSSEETVAPDAPVTLNQSNRLASDTPVLYDRCNGPSKCPGHGLVQSSTGYTGGTTLRHRCKHIVMHQRACCNEHGTIYAISSDFGDRMTTQSM